MKKIASMTAERALDELRDYCRVILEWAGSREDEDRRKRVEAALAFFEGKHVYVSRFKPGDEIFILSQEHQDDDPPGEWWTTRGGHHVQRIVFGGISGDTEYMIEPGDYGYRFMDYNCFPTREEAQAESDRRNKGASDGDL